MLKIIVCDDDRTYLAEVTDMLKRFFGNQGIEADISGCISVEELMQCCTEKDKPDLCFLDIEMGDVNGIDAAKAFKKLCPSCDIAFLTNYISYATDAYETEHFYYVLKEEFPKRLDRIMKRYYKENTHFIVRSGRKEWHFDERDILFLERGRRTCTIKTIGGNLEKMPVPFEQVIERLEGPDFLRCHNSFMINFRNMSSYQKDSFVMNDGTVIPANQPPIPEYLSGAFFKVAGGLDMNLYAILALPICFLFFLFLLYNYLIPRENCRKKLLICFGIAFLLQIPIRYCLLTDTGWIAQYNVAKLLTILSVYMIIFLGGTYVYGGWAQVGLYLIFIEIIFSLYERLFWQTWGYIVHATAEEIALQSQMLTWTPAATIEQITEAGFAALLLIPAKRMKKYSVGQVKLVKLSVIAYLVMGSMPIITRPGFENGTLYPYYFFLSLNIFLVFFAVLTILRKTERESRQLLQLRQYAFAAQTQALGMQKQKIRKFRHDIRKHLDAMSFLQMKKPELKKNPSFLQYRQELEQYRDLFGQGYYCDSEEMNTSMTQIDKYCVKHGIPIAINMRRVVFPGWTREEQLQFGTLLYNLLTALRIDQIAGLQLSGDEIQGQNILRLEVKYRTGPAPAADGEANRKNKERAQETYYKDAKKLLSRHDGSCMKQDTEQGRSFAFLWKTNI